MTPTHEATVSHLTREDAGLLFDLILACRDTLRDRHLTPNAETARADRAAFMAALDAVQQLAAS